MDVNQKMLMVLKGLVKDARILRHEPESCGCAIACDHPYDDDNICPECDCGVSDIMKLAAKAAQIINEAAQSS